MPRQPQGETSLKARIRRQLARLARLVSDEAWNGEIPDLQLSSWPGWIDRLVADLVLLRPLDPVAALRGLNQLNDAVSELDRDIQDIDDILDRQRAYLRLHPAFEAEFANGDPLALADRVVILVTGDDLLDEGADIPSLLLDALGRDGRVAVTLRLENLRRAGSCPTVDLSWRTVEVLLAEPKLQDTLELLAHLELEEQVAAWPMVRRFLEKRIVGPELVAWVRRMLRKHAGDQETLGLVMGCIELCDTKGQPDMAQAMRRESLPFLLDEILLREWLDRLPELQRPLEEARALREVAGIEDKAAAVLFLVRWRDLEAAAGLVMQHHETMAGQSCDTFGRAARILEASAPRAAMLLYRRGAFCVFSTGPGTFDSKPQIARCATLWARYPDGPYDSHEVFLERLARERYAW
ncbi:MAG: DUF6880 family protein [Janthinobacterium lividum]